MVRLRLPGGNGSQEGCCAGFGSGRWKGFGPRRAFDRVFVMRRQIGFAQCVGDHAPLFVLNWEGPNSAKIWNGLQAPPLTQHGKVQVPGTGPYGLLCSKSENCENEERIH